MPMQRMPLLAVRWQCEQRIRSSSIEVMVLDTDEAELVSELECTVMAPERMQ